MKTRLLASFILMLHALALAQSDIIPLTKKRSDGTLTDGFKTGAKTFTISATGTLEWAAGGALTGASFFRTAAGLAIGTDVQAHDDDLDVFANITPTGDVQAILLATDNAAIRTLLGLVIGTNVQAYDADLTTWAGITPSANVQTLLGAADYAAMRTQLGLVIGTNVQAYDADLTTWAGITPTANMQSLLASADHTLLYDAINSRIMINTATSQAAALTISTTVGGDDALILRDSTNGGNARFYFTTPLGGPPDLHIQSDRLYLNALTYVASIASTDGTLEVCNGEVFKADHCYQFIVQTNGANTVIFYGGAGLDTTIRPYAGQTLDLSPDGDPIKMGGNISVTKTIITAGTTGNQTINKTSGRVNFAAAATSLVVTNSYVTANSVIQCTIATNDSTMTSVSVVAGSGSFTIYANAAPTAECAVNFTVTN